MNPHRPSSRPGLLDGRVIAIVGAGPGVGRTLALKIAREGGRVVVAARTTSTLESIVEEVRAAGGTAMAVRCDVSDPGSVRVLREKVEERYDAVHGLVNSAFAAPSMKKLADTEHKQILHGLDLSVLGALRATQEFAPLLEKGDGSVVMMASAVIHHSRERYAGYKVAKTALVALAHSLATELGHQGIRVNTVAPGYIYGDTLKAYFEHLAGKYGGSVDDVYQYTAAKMDLHRLPSEEEIADPVLFLLSGLSSAITGQTLTVDCGEFHT